MDKLKVIKAIVVMITFLLVFGSLMLLTIIYKKAQQQPMTDTYSESSLQEPQGSSIISIDVLQENLAILVKGGGLSDRIIIYNPQKMAKIATINVQDDQYEQ